MVISKILNKIHLIFCLKKFKSAGNNISIGRGFSFVNPQNIEIGNRFSAGSNLRLQAWCEYKGEKNTKDPSILIGDNVSFMDNCHISCVDCISIGNGTLLGDNVFVTDNFHGSSAMEELKIPPLERKLYSKGSVLIGDNVWLGRNVCIMPNVSIGNGVIVGANSVVTSDIEEGCIAVGCPAKVMRKVCD